MLGASLSRLTLALHRAQQAGLLNDDEVRIITSLVTEADAADALTDDADLCVLYELCREET